MKELTRAMLRHLTPDERAALRHLLEDRPAEVIVDALAAALAGPGPVPLGPDGPWVWQPGKDAS